MYFCINCGNRIENEQGLCGVCGTNVIKLIEMKERESDFHVESKKGRIGVIFEDIIHTFKGLFLSPIKTLKEIAPALSGKLVFIIMVVLSLLQGVLNLWIVKALIGAIPLDNNPNINIMNRNNVGNNREALKENLLTMLGQNKTKIVSYSLIFNIVILIGAAALIYLLWHFIFKTKIDGIKLWKSMVISIIPYVIFKFLAIVSSYISLILVILFSVLSIVTFILMLYESIKVSLPLEDEKIIMVTSLLFVLMVFLALNTANQILVSFFSKLYMMQIIYIYFINLFSLNLQSLYF